MSRDISIKINKKQLFSITTVFNNLHYEYGISDNYYRLKQFGFFEDEYLTVFNPLHIGRGVQLLYSKEDTIFHLSLPMPASSFDIDVFYSLSKTIIQECDPCLMIDNDKGEYIHPNDLNILIQQDTKDSIQLLANWDKQKTGIWTLPCAYYPICFKTEELISYGDEKHYVDFSNYLHIKQSLGAYYSCPIESKISNIGKHTLVISIVSDSPCIIPIDPLSEFGKNGEYTKVLFAYQNSSNSLLLIDYKTFINYLIIKDIIHPFDASHLYFEPINEKELLLMR